MKKFLVLAVFFFVASVMILTGCDSSSGGSDDGTAPRISNLIAVTDPDSTVEPASFAVGSTVYFVFNAYDEDLDLAKVEIEVEKGGVDILDAAYALNEQTTAECRGGVMCVFSEAGTYEVEIEVEDKKGNDSNSLKKTITVVAP